MPYLRPWQAMQNAQLEKAFLETEYRVFQPEWIIRIGHFHPALDRWLAGHGVSHWIFLSPCNPHANLMSAADNDRRMAWLKALLAGFAFWEGEGRPANADWPAEPSMLVGGLTDIRADELARSFEQLAYVKGADGGKAKLRWMSADQRS